MRAAHGSNCYVKVAGNPLNPLHWPRMIGNLLAGRLQRTLGMRSMFNDGDEGGTGFVVDGFDDAANAISGSGLSRQLAAILQASVFYPLVLPLVNIGATGSRAEFREARQSLAQSGERLDQMRTALMEFLHAPQVEGDMRTHLIEADGGDHARFAQLLLKRLATLPDRDSLPPQLWPLLHAYCQQVEQHQSLRMAVRAGPAALVATHGMLAGVVGYEGGALAEAIGGPGAGAATAAIGLGATVVMALGQVAMAVYGVVAAVRCALAHRRLRREETALQTYSVLSAAQRQELLHENRVQQKLQRYIGAANGALAAGQVLMVLGGGAIGLGLPLLVVGALLTIGAIVGKLVAQHAYDQRFDHDATDWREDVQAAELLATRQAALQQTVWCDIVSATERARLSSTEPYAQQQALERAWASLYGDDPARRAQCDAMLSRHRKLLLGLMLRSQQAGLAGLALLVPADAQFDAQVEQACRQQRLERTQALLEQLKQQPELETALMQRVVMQLAEAGQGKPVSPFLIQAELETDGAFGRKSRQTFYSFNQQAYTQGLLSQLGGAPASAAWLQAAEVVERALGQTVAAEFRQTQQRRFASAGAALATLAGAAFPRT